MLSRPRNILDEKVFPPTDILGPKLVRKFIVPILPHTHQLTDSTQHMRSPTHKLEDLLCHDLDTMPLSACVSSVVGHPRVASNALETLLSGDS